MTPAAVSSRILANSVSVSRDDSTEVGSSRIRIFGRPTSALAISTTCCSDTLSSATRERASMRSKPKFASSAGRRLIGLRPVDNPFRAAVRHLAEQDVLRDAEVRKQAQFLIDGADPEFDGVARIANGDRLAIEENRPGVGRRRAGEDLDQRRLCPRRSRRTGRARAPARRRTTRRRAPDCRRRPC